MFIKKNNYICSFSLQTTPTTEEIGHCDEIRVSEIGGTSVTIFKQGIVWVILCCAINVTETLSLADIVKLSLANQTINHQLINQSTK